MTKIVYSLSYASTNYNSEIYIMNSNGTGQTRLTQNNTLYNSQPIFSLDGKKSFLLYLIITTQIFIL